MITEVYNITDDRAPVPVNTNYPLTIPISTGISYLLQIPKGTGLYLFNTDNPSEVYNQANADYTDSQYFYKQFTATTPNYSINSGTATYIFVNLTGLAFALPLTFPVNSTPQLN